MHPQYYRKLYKDEKAKNPHGNPQPAPAPERKEKKKRPKASGTPAAAAGGAKLNNLMDPKALARDQKNLGTAAEILGPLKAPKPMVRPATVVL